MSKIENGKQLAVICAVLLKHDGPVTLAQIYDDCRDYPEFQIKTYENRIRAELQRNCKTSAMYERFNGKDLIYTPVRGVWGLKSSNNSAALAADEVEALKSIYRKLPEKTEKEYTIKQRVGQRVFSEMVRERYNHTCPLTGVRERKLIISGHFKPWKNSTDYERLDPENGAPFYAGIDKAFDQGFITLDDDGYPMYSPHLTKDTREMFQRAINGRHVTLTPRNRVYLEFHRCNCFQK